MLPHGGCSVVLHVYSAHFFSESDWTTRGRDIRLSIMPFLAFFFFFLKYRQQTHHTAQQPLFQNQVQQFSKASRYDIVSLWLAYIIVVHLFCITRVGNTMALYSVTKQQDLQYNENILSQHCIQLNGWNYQFRQPLKIIIVTSLQHTFWKINAYLPALFAPCFGWLTY